MDQSILGRHRLRLENLRAQQEEPRCLLGVCGAGNLGFRYKQTMTSTVRKFSKHLTNHFRYVPADDLYVPTVEKCALFLCEMWQFALRNVLIDYPSK